MALFLLLGLTPWNTHSIVKVSLSQSDGQLWFHPLLSGHNMITMWSRGLKFRSPSLGCQGFQVLQRHRVLSACTASESTILSLTAPRTLTRSPRSPQTDFTSSEAITRASSTTKTGFIRTSVWIAMLWLGCHVLRKTLTASGMLDFYPL